MPERELITESMYVYTATKGALATRTVFHAGVLLYTSDSVNDGVTIFIGHATLIEIPEVK